MTDTPLLGRVAVVIGASRGIGRAIAERLGSAGASVVAAARTVAADAPNGGAAATAALINERGGRSIALPLDLESAESREALISTSLERFGKIDILVNNAGTAAYLPTDKMPLATALAQTQAYFLGPWHLCHLALPSMKARGEGWIVNIGSCTVEMPKPPLDEYHAFHGYESLYGGLKAAIHRFSGGLAAEAYTDNISVNVVAPVLGVWTPGLASLNLGFSPNDPMWEAPEEIPEAVLDIVCREPRSFTGQVAFSHQFLAEIGRSTRSLDGKSVVTAR